MAVTLKEVALTILVGVPKMTPLDCEKARPGNAFKVGAIPYDTTGPPESNVGEKIVFLLSVATSAERAYEIDPGATSDGKIENTLQVNNRATVPLHTDYSDVNCGVR